MTTASTGTSVPVFFSWGMGLESTAILVRWILYPETRYVLIRGERHYFSLSDLVVMVAQTGDEHDDTRRLCETFVLPLLRLHAVRFVELARAGHLQKEGVVVLQDTRSPEVLNTQGVWKLSDELNSVGTVPQVSNHQCAQKFKIFVIETWLWYELRWKHGTVPHAFGYNAQETGRVAKCARQIEAANLIRPAKKGKNELPPLRHVVFGYSATEGTRVEKAEKYDREHNRVGCFPLVDWNWGRPECEAFLAIELGVRWPKSACVYCCFNERVRNETGDGLDRLRAHPEAAARSLLMERVALSFNPKAKLFATVSLHEIVERALLVEVLVTYGRLLAEAPWTLYRVRRIHNAPAEGKTKGTRPRCIEPVRTGRRESLDTDLALIENASLVREGDIWRAYVSRPSPGLFPGLEEFYVVAPTAIDAKAPYGLDAFERDWTDARNGTRRGQTSLFATV